MSNPTAREIAAALGAPESNLSANWPQIENALAALKITSPLALIAALATIHVECPSFTPQTEKYNGDPQIYFSRYDGRHDLGNTQPGDGFRFRGRGYVQITGRFNYAKYSRETGVDLAANPEAALYPRIAATIFAAYFHDHYIANAAEAEDWEHVRRLVNGGLTGFADFMSAVNKLKAIFPVTD